MLRLDTGNSPGRRLSAADDVTGNSVTSSSQNSPLVTRHLATSSPLSPGQSQFLLRLSSPGNGPPGLVNGRDSVLPPGERNNHHNNDQQQQKVISRTFRAVSVPAASVQRDLEVKGQGHQRHSCTEVVKLTLQPTRE